MASEGSVRIATNTTAMFTADLLRRNSGGVADSMERLSSGMRINSAKDDAAGLQISNRLSSQINGTTVAIKNATDAISMAQTAEGAVEEVTNMLFRLRDLSLQAANGSNTDQDRGAMQKEAKALLSEIDRTNETTTFGGKRLFKSTGASRIDTKERDIVNSLATSWLYESEQLIKDHLGLDGKGATLKIDLENVDGAGGTAAYVQSQVPGGGGPAYNLTMVIDLDDFGASGGGGSLELDEVILHEMTHAIQGVNFAEWGNMPAWFSEGSAEAMRGADDRLKNDIASFGINGIWGEVNAKRNSNANPGTALENAGAYSGGYVIQRYMHSELGEAGYKSINSELAGGATLNAALNTASAGRWADVNALFTELGAAGGGGAATKFEEFINTNMDLTNADNGSLAGFDATGVGPELENAMQGKTGGGDGATSFQEYYVSGDDDTTQADFNSANWDTSGDPSITEVAIENYSAEIGEGGHEVSAQVGANAHEEVVFNLGTFGSANLGISNIDLTKDPQGAIVAIDDALKAVDSSRASLGATMNRLGHTISNLTNINENVSASRSRIQDVDMAKESASLAKRQVLQQSATAMLTQAINLPSSMLSLLQ
ncbi:flagellinolysin [Ferrimonas sp. SCSIO 43195]|nr:flagellinolysin [Ferrimonas sp. SCSIO 43195]